MALLNLCSNSVFSTNLVEPSYAFSGFANSQSCAAEKKKVNRRFLFGRWPHTHKLEHSMLSTFSAVNFSAIAKREKAFVCQGLTVVNITEAMVLIC